MTALAQRDPGDSLPRTRSILGSGSVRRLCIDLIGAEQDRLLRERRLTRRHHVATRIPGASPSALDTLEIDEETLGFDSLGILDLAGSVSRYFCLPDSGAEDLLLVHRGLGDWVRIVLAHLERVGAEARIGFETSGSTGAPKRILQAAGDLEAEVDEIGQNILGPALVRRRILSKVPPRHIYGFLWGILLPERAAAESAEFHRATGEAVLHACRPGDVVIGTPFTWEQAARSGIRLPRQVTGVTSAGPSTRATWQAAEGLGLDRFVEIYGATETGGLGWRSAWEDPFRLSTRAVRDAETLRRRATGARLAVQDHLAWHDATHFTVTGRRDTVVQVAGINVNTTEVVRLLKRVKGVADAAVRLDGPRIKALVVPHDPDADTEALEEALRARAIRDLAPPARPDRYDFAPDIPRTAQGKLADW